MIVARQEKHLGTIIEIKLDEKDASFFSLCFEELRRIEDTYSRFKDDSRLSFLNAHLGTWHSIDDEFLFLLESSEKINKETLGFFDITLKSTLDALGYDKTYSFKEKNVKTKVIDTIKNLLPGIEIDYKRKKVLLRKEIDFGGIGKGFALDKVAHLLEEKRVQNYYINAGGDIYAKGSFEILLEHPDDPGKMIGKVVLDRQAIAGSSSNRRKWGTHHHLINAKTKKPEHSVKAIFVMHEQGMYADAYATTFFTAGFEEGILLSQQLNIKTFMISSNNKMYVSEDFPVKLFN